MILQHCLMFRADVIVEFVVPDRVPPPSVGVLRIILRSILAIQRSEHMLQILNRRVEFYGMLEPHVQYNVPHALAGVLLPYVLSLVVQMVGALHLTYCLGKPQ